MKTLCSKCLLAGTCLNWTVFAITPEEVQQNPQLVRAVRNFAYDLSISYHTWPDFALTLASETKVRIVNVTGETIEPDLSVFLPTDKEIDTGAADFNAFYLRITDWFRHNCCIPLPDIVTPYVRREGMPRFVTLANLLLAAYPEETSSWPRRIAANDNTPKLRAINDNCPRI